MIEITRERLRELYYANTNKKLCEIFHCSKATLIKYITEAGIPLKGKGNPSGANQRRIKIINNSSDI